MRQIPDDLRILADRGIEPVSGISDLHERTSVELLDEEGLNIRLRDALSAAAGPTDVAVQFSESEDSHPWIAFADGKERTYLGRVTGSELAVMFQRYKSRLFGLNIRNYIGDNITNRTIRKTATKEPTKFFFFNNGVTALASGVEVDGSKPRTLRCRSFNIINGAQTVRSLSKAHSDDPDALRRVSVLIRIIEYPSKSSHIEQSFLDNVTRFNNTQNAIKISDFRSNDPIQQDIRAKFDKVPARKGKKFIYKNKRSTEGQSKIVVGMEEFAKTLYAFEYGPADAYGGTRHLFDASKTGGYTALYGRDGEVLPAISEETFRRYLGIWFSCEFAYDLLKAESIESPHPAMERKWLVFYALGEAIRVFYGHLHLDLPSALQKLASPSWYEEPDTKGPKLVLKKYFPIAIFALKNAYDAAVKVPGFAHRNWFRDKDTLTAIRYEIDKLWPMFKAESSKYSF